MQDNPDTHRYLKDMWIQYHRLIDGTLSPKSIAHYQQEFTNFCRWANMLDILHSSQVTPEVAEKYIRYSYSIRRSAPFEIATLKRIWDITLSDHTNPWNQRLFNLIRINTPTPQTHRPFTHNECVKIFKTVDTDLKYPLLFAYWYGMRIGSICSLKWSDFKHWRRSNAFVHLPPKTARSKPIYLEIPIVPDIAEVLSRLERRDDYLFPELRAQYMKSLPSLCHRFKVLLKKCHIKDSLIGRASVHSFRATFITRMDEIGAPIYITDSITGHAPRDMHGIYSKPSAVAKRKWIIRALKPLGSIL